jgi:hypothetical protein
MPKKITIKNEGYFYFIPNFDSILQD